MSNIVKQVISILVSVGIIMSVAGCSKRKEKTEDGSVFIEKAESFMDSLLSLDYKKMQKEGFEEEDLASLQEFEENHFGLRETLEKATYEIDEDSLSIGNTSANVEVAVMMPDYQKAAEDAEGDLQEYLNAINSQKKKDYQSFTVKIRFRIKDDASYIINQNELHRNVITPVYLTAIRLTLESHQKSIQEKQATSSATTTVPTETSPAVILQFLIGDMKKVELNEEVFANAVRKTDSSIIEIEAPHEVDDPESQMTKLGSVISGNVMYTYSEFATETAAEKQFDSLSTIAESSGQYYVKEPGWGCSACQYSSVSMMIYYSGTVVIMCSSSETTIDDIIVIEQFADNLAGA